MSADRDDDTVVLVFPEGVRLDLADGSVVEDALRRARRELEALGHAPSDAGALVLLALAYQRDAGRRSRD